MASTECSFNFVNNVNNRRCSQTVMAARCCDGNWKKNFCQEEREVRERREKVRTFKGIKARFPVFQGFHVVVLQILDPSDESNVAVRRRN